MCQWQRLAITSPRTFEFSNDFMTFHIMIRHLWGNFSLLFTYVENLRDQKTECKQTFSLGGGRLKPSRTISQQFNIQNIYSHQIYFLLCCFTKLSKYNLQLERRYELAKYYNVRHWLCGEMFRRNLIHSQPCQQV